MLIDIHTHATLYQVVPHRGGFHFITPGELVATMDRAGIDMAVVLPLVSPSQRTALIPTEQVLDICARYPGLRIAGTYHGYFDKTPGSPENEAVLQRINAARPNILILGFGMPLQERWLLENWERVDANLALTGGAVFDYLSGELRRPPRWMTEHGLEWLGRMLIEPRRLWRRYVVGNPLFLWRVLLQRFGLLKFD